jgi:hypothetical protein
MQNPILVDFAHVATLTAIAALANKASGVSQSTIAAA